MSGIYIPGMEMPKGGYRTIEIGFDADGHPMAICDGSDVCDVIPVPDHGDLIDRDTARGSIKPWSPEDERTGCTFDTVKKLMHTLLDRAPTIIPADGGKA